MAAELTTRSAMPLASRLDVSGSEALAEGLAALDGKAKGIRIDLQKVDFFEPYGIAFLALACRQFASAGVRPCVILPPTNTPQAFYLKRMSVPQILRKWADLENYLWPKGRGWAKSSVLLELTPFRKAAEIEHVIVNRLYEMLKTQLNYGPSDLSAFSSIVAELCENVQDHSGERESGFVAAQTYKSKFGITSGKRCLLVAVVDTGMGIRASLGERYDVSSWTHSVALENATLRNFSRKANRGLGFETVRRICQDRHGHFEIRSGDARLSIKQNRVTTYDGCFFPGTQVAIKLWE